MLDFVRHPSFPERWTPLPLDHLARNSYAVRRPLRVVLAEDETTIASNLAEMIALIGDEVVSIVDTAPAAIAAAAMGLPDVLIMDIRLAHQSDGIAAALKIRETLNIPTIFMTAYNDDETRERAEAARPIGYAIKPVLFPELKELLDLASGSLD